MASEASFKFLVLWGSELRAAAAALSQVDRVFKDKTVPEKEVQRVILDALNTSRTALLGCEASDHLVICEADRAKYEPRTTVVAPHKTKKRDNPSLYDDAKATP